MSKYLSLGIYLENQDNKNVRLTFNEIERILGFKLPKYLRKWQAGWYGTAEASPTHVQKSVWESVGYHVKHVDIIEEIVTFEKI